MFPASKTRIYQFFTNLQTIFDSLKHHFTLTHKKWRLRLWTQNGTKHSRILRCPQLKLFIKFLHLFQSSLLGITDCTPQIKQKWFFGKLAQIRIFQCSCKVAWIRLFRASLPDALSCTQQIAPNSCFKQLMTITDMTRRLLNNCHKLT